MSYHYLPTERRNDKIPKEYLYLKISKYSDEHFKPSEGKKKLTKEQTDDKMKCIHNQNTTFERLSTGYFNSYNTGIELKSIISGFSPLEDSDFDRATVYRIDPSACIKSRNGYTDRYTVTEFNVVKEIKTSLEFVNQLIKDGLINEFAGSVFESLRCSNDGYYEKMIAWFSKLTESHPDVRITLSDIVLDKTYEHKAYDGFKVTSVYDCTKRALNGLIENDLIDYIGEYEYDGQALVATLINCGLSNIALNYLNASKLNPPYSTQSTSDRLPKAIKLHSDDPIVKEIALIMGITVSEVSLRVENCEVYGEGAVAFHTFRNVDDAKTYIIKEYDVPFSVLARNEMKFSYGDYDFEIT